MRIALICSIVFLSAQLGISQTDVSPQVSAGYISPSAYTNSYFGFHLPLSRGMRPGKLPSDPLHYFFEAQKFEHNKITMLMLVLDPPLRKGTNLAIGGRPFIMTEDKSDTDSGTLYQALYFTGIGNHRIAFVVSGLNKSDFSQAKKDVESITFFDPSQSVAEAGADATPYN